jgi:putative endonuclease
MDNTTGVGFRAEQLAAKYLEKEGYKILENNYRVAGSEVDLIALKDDTVCFIEVKARGSDDYGMPEEFVDRRKRRRIIRAAKIFTAHQRYYDCYVRFDIISILNKTNDIEIKHIEHAFEGE